MKKRYLALLLAFAMVFAFTACTGNDPGTEHFEYFGEDIKIIKAVPDR